MHKTNLQNVLKVLSTSPIEKAFYEYWLDNYYDEGTNPALIPEVCGFRAKFWYYEYKGRVCATHTELPPVDEGRKEMSHRAAILAALTKSGALCDDCLSEVTEITPRQTINITCRALHSSKTLSRPRETCFRCKRIKIVNRLLSGAPIERRAPVTQPTGIISAKNDRPWYWEGNVQTKIVGFLSSQGCTVHSESDTASRQQGKDIVAADCSGRTVWVTVKGFPDKSKNIQARHWFAGALLDLARYRDENADALLAMGLPSGFTTYETLIRRTKATRKFLGYSVYWVAPDGAVTRDDPPEKAITKPVE